MNNFKWTKIAFRNTAFVTDVPSSQKLLNASVNEGNHCGWAYATCIFCHLNQANNVVVFITNTIQKCLQSTPDHMIITKKTLKGHISDFSKILFN